MRNTPAHDKRKQAIYFPGDMIEEIKAEAERLDRSLSWVVQRAWMLSRKEIARSPAPPKAGGAK